MNINGISNINLNEIADKAKEFLPTATKCGMVTLGVALGARARSSLPRLVKCANETLIRSGYHPKYAIIKTFKYKPKLSKVDKQQAKAQYQKWQSKKLLFCEEIFNKQHEQVVEKLTPHTTKMAKSTEKFLVGMGVAGGVLVAAEITKALGLNDKTQLSEVHAAFDKATQSLQKEYDQIEKVIYESIETFTTQIENLSSKAKNIKSDKARNKILELIQSYENQKADLIQIKADLEKVLPGLVPHATEDISQQEKRDHDTDRQAKIEILTEVAKKRFGLITSILTKNAVDAYTQHYATPEATDQILHSKLQAGGIEIKENTETYLKSTDMYLLKRAFLDLAGEAVGVLPGPVGLILSDQLETIANKAGFKLTISKEELKTKIDEAVDEIRSKINTTKQSYLNHLAQTSTELEKIEEVINKFLKEESKESEQMSRISSLAIPVIFGVAGLLGAIK